MTLNDFSLFHVPVGVFVLAWIIVKMIRWGFSKPELRAIEFKGEAESPESN